MNRAIGGVHMVILKGENIFVHSKKVKGDCNLACNVKAFLVTEVRGVNFCVFSHNKNF